jgi:hypothetical protein
MSFAHITGSTIDTIRGSAPTEGVRQDTGQTVSGIQPTDIVTLAACGWRPVTDVAKPADTGTDTYDRSLQLLAGVPTVVWTQRPWTQAELDSRTADTNRTTIVEQATTALTDNATFIAIATPTTAQNAAQIKALTRQVNKLIRLAIGKLDATT